MSLSGGRVQHCSMCRKKGHRRPKCPGINAENAQNESVENAPNEGQGAENAEPNVEMTSQNATNEVEGATNEGQMGDTGQMNGPKRNKLGIRRPKLIIRRPKTKGLVIKYSIVIPTQASQTISTVPSDEMGKGRSKETSSSETSLFMYQVLGSVGYDAVLPNRCSSFHPWVWTQPPYNKGSSTSPTIQMTQDKKALVSGNFSRNSTNSQPFEEEQ